MAVDPSFLGHEFPGTSLLITRSRLQHFAKATGQSDPIYLDPEAARQAGHPDIPVPPSFLMASELEAPDPLGWIAELGADLRSVLHGEQRFAYHHMAYAGDELTTRSVLTDIYAKRGGELEFVERTTSVENQRGELVADLVGVIIIRHPSAR